MIEVFKKDDEYYLSSISLSKNFGLSGSFFTSLIKQICKKAEKSSDEKILEVACLIYDNKGLEYFKSGKDLNNKSKLFISVNLLKKIVNCYEDSLYRKSKITKLGIRDFINDLNPNTLEKLYVASSFIITEERNKYYDEDYYSGLRSLNLEIQNILKDNSMDYKEKAVLLILYNDNIRKTEVNNKTYINFYDTAKYFGFSHSWIWLECKKIENNKFITVNSEKHNKSRVIMNLYIKPRDLAKHLFSFYINGNNDEYSEFKTRKFSVRSEMCKLLNNL